jgi:hypothetical protein
MTTITDQLIARVREATKAAQENPRLKLRATNQEIARNAIKKVRAELRRQVELSVAECEGEMVANAPVKKLISATAELAIFDSLYGR